MISRSVRRPALCFMLMGLFAVTIDRTSNGQCQFGCENPGYFSRLDPADPTIRIDYELLSTCYRVWRTDDLDDECVDDSMPVAKGYRQVLTGTCSGCAPNGNVEGEGDCFNVTLKPGVQMIDCWADCGGSCPD